jgi:flagellar biosynthesis/type III secretory pathway protein FliH
LEQADFVKQSWAQERIERFEYPVMPFTPAVPMLFGLEELSGENEGTGFESKEDGTALPACAATAEKLAEETRRAFAAGRERGVLEGRQFEREGHATALKVADDQRRQQTAKLIDQFALERDRYLSAVEKEVVKLALAVAARILRREAQMDPLLLTGAVRVALGQLSGSTEARVRVPTAELDLWKEALALLPNPSMKPKVLAGEGMLLGDCMIETTLGSVDLGIRSQLGEIERGFFDSAARSKVPIAGVEPLAALGESRV